MKIFKLKFRAFSILEVAISLTIIGVLAMAVIKGQQLLFQAKIDKTVTQIEAIKIAVDSFKSTYNQLPGDYNGLDLGTEKHGDGNGNISTAEEKEAFWDHLEAADLINKKQRIPAIGGKFNIENENGHFLTLTNSNGGGVLTFKDAIKIKMKLDGDSDLSFGIVKIKNMNNGAFIQQFEVGKEKCYILYIELQ